VSVGSLDNEERRLLAEYQTAARFYSWAVTELSNQRGTAGTFNQALKVVDEARNACEKARLALAEFKKSGPQI
jgi:hypothetical protein